MTTIRLELKINFGARPVEVGTLPAELPSLGGEGAVNARGCAIVFPHQWVVMGNSYARRSRTSVKRFTFERFFHRAQGTVSGLLG
jgi:hypothetical protein